MNTFLIRDVTKKKMGGNEKEQKEKIAHCVSMLLVWTSLHLIALPSLSHRQEQCRRAGCPTRDKRYIDILSVPGT